MIAKREKRTRAYKLIISFSVIKERDHQRKGRTKDKI